jgi:hypothetical protein
MASVPSHFCGGAAFVNKHLTLKPFRPSRRRRFAPEAWDTDGAVSLPLGTKAAICAGDRRWKLGDVTLWGQSHILTCHAVGSVPHIDIFLPSRFAVSSGSVPHIAPWIGVPPAAGDLSMSGGTPDLHHAVGSVPHIDIFLPGRTDREAGAWRGGLIVPALTSRALLMAGPCGFGSALRGQHLPGPDKTRAIAQSCKRVRQMFGPGWHPGGEASSS